MINKDSSDIKGPCVSASEVQMAAELGEDGLWSANSPPQIVKPNDLQASTKWILEVKLYTKGAKSSYMSK